MKDARFKELLNLHLDHRLSDSEAEELEAALEGDPSRRKTLRDYEAMQSACTALFARSESQAPSSQSLRRALRRAEDRMAHPSQVRDGWGWTTWGITGGVAACVALLVARLSLPAVSTASATDAETADLGANIVAAASGIVPDSARLSSRGAALPRHLTFAALGLNPGSMNADAVSRWILEMEEPAMFATLAEANAAGEALRVWLPPGETATPSVPHFSSRPITSMGQGASPVGGFQFGTASFRFER
jgi:hypothetical protein